MPFGYIRAFLAIRLTQPPSVFFFQKNLLKSLDSETNSLVILKLQMKVMFNKKGNELILSAVFRVVSKTV